jgi:hypothetical protein
VRQYTEYFITYYVCGSSQEVVLDVGNVQAQFGQNVPSVRLTQLDKATAQSIGISTALLKPAKP